MEVARVLPGCHHMTDDAGLSQRLTPTLEQICREAGMAVADVEAGCLLGDKACCGNDGPSDRTLRLRFAWSAGATAGDGAVVGDGAAGAESAADATGAADLQAIAQGRRYLVASITKPIVALLAVQLIAEGRLSLQQRVADLLPEYSRPSLRRIAVRHLLTHTCGLPDMLPNNAALRMNHAPLREFVRAAADCPPEFVAGADCRYSSMGFALLGEILEQRTGRPLPQLLRDRLLEPLGMRETWLGLPAEQADQLLPTVQRCELPIWQPADTDWNWNSRYWRTLGAPWGGLISTTADLGRLAALLLRGGLGPQGQRILSRVAVTAALRNQTNDISELPETLRRQQPWALGWRMNWPGHAASFGDFLTPSAVGHWGATGTLIWLDPARRQYAVVLTTQPYELSMLPIQRISNVICAALADVADQSAG